MKLQHLVLPTTPERIYGWIISESEEGGNWPEISYGLFEEIIGTVDQGVNAAFEEYGFEGKLNLCISGHWDVDYTMAYDVEGKQLLLVSPKVFGRLHTASVLGEFSSLQTTNYPLKEYNGLRHNVVSWSDYLFNGGAHEAVHFIQSEGLGRSVTDLQSDVISMRSLKGLSEESGLAYDLIQMCMDFEVEARDVTRQIANRVGRSDFCQFFEEGLRTQFPEFYNKSAIEIEEMLRGRNRS